MDSGCQVNGEHGAMALMCPMDGRLEKCMDSGDSAGPHLLGEVII
jgi:hypothetical protein